VIDWAGRLVPYPPEVADRYRSLGLWGSRTVADEFAAVARRHPERTAVVAEHGAFTFADLDELSDRLASGLLDLGLRPGGRVVVQLTNRLMTVVAWYGLLKAGLVPVCTLAAHRGHEIGSISRKVEAVAHLVEHQPTGFDLVGFGVEQTRSHPTMHHLLTLGADAGAPGTRLEDLIARSDPGQARRDVAAVQRGIDPDEVVAFQLSGGTTGVPKLIPRLHAEYWYNARAYAAARQWDHDTRVAHLIPIIHNAGITCGVHAAHAVGAALVLATADLDQAFPVLVRERATAILVGHAHFGMVDHPLFDQVAAGLEQVLLSGAAVPERVFRSFEQHGVQVGQKFGMGEGLFTLTGFDWPRELRATTVGLPISAEDEFRVIDPDSLAELPDGVVGELACRGPYTIRGYFDAPEINADAFLDDGFYRTGDLVEVVASGGRRSIAMAGRIKDLVNRGGEKVSAAEVEGLLVQHPRISAAAVVAMPDERLGERACAFLVAAGEPLSMVEVQAHLQGLGVATFKWPERLEWIDTMPETPVGKLDKKRLRADILVKLGVLG
jgi:2,3-dihydroxybenzoate-AMP ligase